MTDAAPRLLVSRACQPQDTVVRLPGVAIGGSAPVLMAGPCSIESETQIRAIARCVAGQGGKILRGGAFKPRTSPYSFQGLGEAGLKLMRQAADAYGLLCITEVMEPAEVKRVGRYADILQIGTRNMQNYPLLRAVGRSDKPILLKRGLAATLDEFLMAAEYILCEGNHQVILCERGVRSFVDHCRFMLDLAALPVLRARTHLPIIVDPSHAAGQRELVIPLALAALAAGADGLLVEVHHDPDQAQSDGPQALTPEGFARLAGQVQGAWQIGRQTRRFAGLIPHV